MSDRNQVTREGNRIIKKFGSHIDFVKELSIYKKLDGTDLAPRLIDAVPNTIQHEYVEGINLYDAILQNNGKKDRLFYFFDLFTTWYRNYREIVKINLGNADFEKFILSEDRLVYVDFEHCKPGYSEEDIANLLIQISNDSIESAALFRVVAERNLHLDMEVLDRLEKMR